MYIVIDNTTKVVLFAGLTNDTVNSGDWCDQYPLSNYTVINGVTLPAGFVQSCWTYNNSTWTVVSGKEPVVYDAELRKQTLPTLSAGDVVTGSSTSSGVTTSFVDITWNAVATATYYEFRYKQTSESIWSSWILTASDGITNSTRIYGLVPNKTYEISLRATCLWGVSDWCTPIEVTSASGSQGALQVSLSNDTHTVYCDNQGDNPDYTDSGTQIHVYEGLTELTYDGSGTDSGTWRLTISTVAITEGSISDSGIYATMGDVSNMTQESAQIVFTIVGKTTSGVDFTLQKPMSFVKVSGGTNRDYDIEIESTNGTVFRVGQAKTTYLIAHVYLNGAEVTGLIDASKFRWRRVSYISNPTGDTAWNNTYATGYKIIELTIDSVNKLATFHCDIMT